MSIAAVSSSLVARIAAAAPVDPVRDSVQAAPQLPAPRAGGGRRHELVDAVIDALDIDPTARDRRTGQAVFRFAHALLHDLRRVGGDERLPGRRDWSAVGPRLDALATAAAAPPADALAEPKPLTTTTAALHVMKVPSSRLIEAFQTLRETVPSLAEVSGGEATDARAQLAALLQRLAGVAPDGDTDTVAGALLHATA